MYVSMDKLDRAFARVRAELHEVGLLGDGVYLDQIDLVRVALPALSTMGYVYDGLMGWFDRLAGFRERTIYVPIVAPIERRKPGATLSDVIRHEFAHAWAWLAPGLMRRPWFHRTFGGRYSAAWSGERPEFDARAFVSTYATTSPAEDFAESFMTFLRCRRSLHRFRTRPHLLKKLTAIATLVRTTASDLRRR